MLHGRAGAYSSVAKGEYTATTLSNRHKSCGEYWASRGYFALLVDSFGPRNYPEGFVKGSYEDRPAQVSEQTVRPLDAYRALRYLRARKDVNLERVGIQGWSNGATTVLVAMSPDSPGMAQTGFRAALAEYPDCGMEAIRGEYKNYAPLLLLLASAYEEVSPERCEKFAEKAKKGGASLALVVYQGAEHNFDDPGKTRQSEPANAKATTAARCFEKQLTQSAYPPIAYIGRGGATNCAVPISCPIHLRIRFSRIAASTCPSSPPLNNPRTSISSTANRQYRSFPSAVSRMRLQFKQNGLLTLAINPTRPWPSR